MHFILCFSVYVHKLIYIGYSFHGMCRNLSPSLLLFFTPACDRPLDLFLGKMPRGRGFTPKGYLLLCDVYHHSPLMFLPYPLVFGSITAHCLCFFFLDCCSFKDDCSYPPFTQNERNFVCVLITR
jgi:hypothetical protein